MSRETVPTCQNRWREDLNVASVLPFILQPNRLYSPHTTFLRQSGQSQELASALCSLLLGLGYDAYVVFGYATRDVTLRITTRVHSPYPPEEDRPALVDEGESSKKYAMKPTRDLRSKFLLMMEQREIDRVKAEKQRVAEIEQKRIEELEKPPFDEIYGLRIHAWVLVREGRKDVETDTFIEPSTGLIFPLDTLNYTWIESLWNSTNYWVNIQDPSIGLGSLEYNLGNVEQWEHLLVGEPIGWRKTEYAMEMEEEEIAIADIMHEKHLDMPTPWSLRVYIPHQVLAQKYPGGVNRTWYKHTYVEEFAPYVQTDGLVTKITRFEDFECTKPIRIEEVFENRTDKMIKVVMEFDGDMVTEHFGPGREDAVSKHRYCSTRNIADGERTIEFYHESRWDGKAKLEIGPEEMTIYYLGREDFLDNRYVTYARKGEPPPGVIEGHRKIILTLIEKFLRNENVPASEDTAIREFAQIKRQINLKYHFGKGKVTASTRTFIKPPVSEMSEGLRFNPDLTYGYQAEIGAKPPRQLQLFLQLQELLKVEEEALSRVRGIEDTIAEFLQLRDHEQALPQLDVSLFNIEQNEELRTAMLEREKEMLEYKEKEIIDSEIDYLAPYLAKIGNPEKLSKTQKSAIKEQVLKDFRQMLVDRANDIQKQFERFTERLKEKQKWYTKNQDTITMPEEIEYFEYLNELNFLLQTYDIRLARHRDLSAPRYEAIVRYVNEHPKLQI